MFKLVIDPSSISESTAVGKCTNKVEIKLFHRSANIDRNYFHACLMLLDLDDFIGYFITKQIYQWSKIFCLRNILTNAQGKIICAAVCELIPFVAISLATQLIGTFVFTVFTKKYRLLCVLLMGQFMVFYCQTQMSAAIQLFLSLSLFHGYLQKKHGQMIHMSIDYMITKFAKLYSLKFSNFVVKVLFDKLAVKANLYSCSVVKYHEIFLSVEVNFAF